MSSYVKIELIARREKNKENMSMLRRFKKMHKGSGHKIKIVEFGRKISLWGLIPKSELHIDTVKEWINIHDAEVVKWPVI